jgi:hypothetical protein
MNNDLFEESIRNDKTLQYLASYDVTCGNMFVSKTQEEIDELNLKIANKFNYFKKLIRSGECTLDFISQTVLLRHGAFVQDKKKNIEDIYHDIIKNEKKPISEQDNKIIDKLLNASYKVAKNKKRKKYGL